MYCVPQEVNPLNLNQYFTLNSRRYRQGLLYLDGRNSQKYLHQNQANNATQTQSNFVKL